MASPMRSKAIPSALLLILGLWAPDAWAHRPHFSSPPAYTGAETAFRLPDIEVSRAIYRTAPDADPFWLTFQGEPGATLQVQLGVPHVAELEGFRPTFLLIGPGLPSRDRVPSDIELPPDTGAGVFPTDRVQAPRAFREEITGTTSWILLERSFRIPKAGRYFLAVHVDGPGKYWLSVGDREAFGLVDIAKLPHWTDRARAFHEIQGRPAWMTIAGAGLVLLVLFAAWIGVRAL